MGGLQYNEHSVLYSERICTCIESVQNWGMITVLKTWLITLALIKSNHLFSCSTLSIDSVWIVDPDLSASASEYIGRQIWIAVNNIKIMKDAWRDRHLPHAITRSGMSRAVVEIAIYFCNLCLRRWKISGSRCFRTVNTLFGKYLLRQTVWNVGQGCLMWS